jgi:hypothetical protein
MVTFKERGIYYGYPECCINFFEDDNKKLEEINKQRLKELGIIYKVFIMLYCVPCPKCYAVLLRNSKSVQKWFEIKNRS